MTISIYNRDKNRIIYADQDKCSQVFANLISNAVKNAIVNSEVMINIKSEKEANNTVISIINTGQQIPKDELKSIFNAFEQSSITKKGPEAPV